MRRNAALCALLLAFLLLVTACAPAGLAGTWRRSGETIVLRPDGRCAYTERGGGTYEGVYALEGGQIVMSLGSISITGGIAVEGDTLTLTQGENRFVYGRE